MFKLINHTAWVQLAVLWGLALLGCWVILSLHRWLHPKAKSTRQVWDDALLHAVPVPLICLIGVSVVVKTFGVLLQLSWLSRYRLEWLINPESYQILRHIIVFWLVMRFLRCYSTI